MWWNSGPLNFLLFLFLEFCVVPTWNEETFLQDFREIVKHSFHDLLKILKTCFHDTKHSGVVYVFLLETFKTPLYG